MNKEYYETKIHNILSETDNDDQTIKVLEKAMNYFCSNWDKCEGYKHAIMETIEDQLNNHLSEQSEDDYKELIKILTN